MSFLLFCCYQAYKSLIKKQLQMITTNGFMTTKCYFSYILLKKLAKTGKI